METTKRFPRTAAEAFKNAEYANAFEYPPTKCRVCDLAFGFALALVVVLTTWVLLAFSGVPA